MAWTDDLTRSTFGEEENKYRYRLFGMAGTWSEYWVFGNDKTDLKLQAIRYLKANYDAHIEDTKTGQVYTLIWKGMTYEDEDLQGLS